MPFPRLLVPLLAALCLTGCGNPSAKLIGKWKIAGVSGQQKSAAADALMQMFKMEFEFKTDGKFVVEVSGLGQQKSETGSWKFVKSDDKQLVLMITMPPANKETESRITVVDNDHIAFTPPEGIQTMTAQMDCVRVK